MKAQCKEEIMNDNQRNEKEHELGRYKDAYNVNVFRKSRNSVSKIIPGHLLPQNHF